MKQVLFAILAAVAFCGCAHSKTETPETAKASAVAVASPDLATRYTHIRDFIAPGQYGPGAPTVLEVAYHALEEKHAAGEGKLVGVEDLWAHSLQEGLYLFYRPEVLWGPTGADETADMIGQTTVGPWQMTVANIRKVYGPRYGVDPKWSDALVFAFCRAHPEVQAKMTIDMIEQGYEEFGQRSPYAIQRYFWLDPFVKGEIGQSKDWQRSVVAKPPKGGTWNDLTPAMKADTGFYGKQVLLGTDYTDSGMLFWLYVSGDVEGVRGALRTWRDEKKLVPGKGGHYVRTGDSGGFAISESDIHYGKKHPEIREALGGLVREVQAEPRQ